MPRQSLGSDSWRPVFAAPAPEHWVAIFIRPRGLCVLSDVRLGGQDLQWLSSWLSLHVPRNAELSTSCVYLGLADDWRHAEADGAVAPNGVVGLGSGEGFGEPVGARGSTVQQILTLFVSRVSSGTGEGQLL